MSGSRPLLVRTFKVGARTVTLSVQQLRSGGFSVSVEWEPDVPTRLSAVELQEYRAGRNAALAALGVPTLVVEVP